MSSDGHRYERKFVLADFSRAEVARFVLRHPSFFREIYHQRFVNNVYFDTVARRYYWESVLGAAERVKIRIRWYGELFGDIRRPVLELKRKNGLMVHKDSFRLPDFALQRTTDLSILKDLFRQVSLPDPLKQQLLALKPVLLNRYCREYFLSADSRFRITIDDELHAFPLSPRRNTFLNKYIDRRHVILEVKYNRNSGDSADHITSRFPFRITRWSKYVSGVGDGYAS